MGVHVNMSELLLLELLTVPKEGAPDFFFFFFKSTCPMCGRKEKTKGGV